MLISGNYNPDVLSCLANLSSDEVFTPPAIANRVLDGLPESLWRDPNARFLDPACKSGVFLREIARRLDKGLETVIPDKQQRVNHILTNQLYGIAITDLTALLARRSLYCSKRANGKYSVCSGFGNADGNILYTPIDHTWENGRCTFCGASEKEYGDREGLESHAYQFLHTKRPGDIIKMQFDVIVSNPPYQLSDAGYQRSASPIYQHFVEQAKKLQPRFLTMIIPARWFAGGKGLDAFREEMLHDERLREIHDFPDATQLFPGVQIKGGLCYFLWDRDHPGLCRVSSYEGSELRSSVQRPLLEPGADTFIRYNEAISILERVRARGEPSFMEAVSPRRPFGFATNAEADAAPSDDAVRIHMYKSVRYVGRKAIARNQDWVDRPKVFISMAYGAGESFPHQILNTPLYAEPGTCCSETYLVIGPWSSEAEARNVMSYVSTRFLRFLVLLNKPSQHATRKVYRFVPMQDFSHAWTDEMLYAKYGLNDSEIEFIESMVRPLEPTDG